MGHMNDIARIEKIMEALQGLSVGAAYRMLDSTRATIGRLTVVPPAGGVLLEYQRLLAEVEQCRAGCGSSGEQNVKGDDC